MASGQWVGVFKQVTRAFHGRSVVGLSEGQLLDRFVSTRDEVAFEAIVARHGPMVLGVCRAVLNDPGDVEDAFQATFLVLVRKASGLRDREHLGRWLHGVARKVSTRLRADAWKRRSRENLRLDFDPPASPESDLRDLQSIVREEVDRLAGHERSAVVLCYLEGLTHEEAADRLGWPIGTVKGRLARARDRLRTRLERRGFAVSAGAMAPTLAGGASPPVPTTLIASTIHAASRVSASQTLTAGIVSAQVAILTEGVIQTMSLSKLKLGVVAVVVACTIATPGVVAWQQVGGPEGKTTVQVERNVVTIEGKTTAETTGGPLTLAAEKGMKTTIELIPSGEVTLGAFSVWSRRLLDAQIAESPSPERKLAALKSYADRSKKWKAEMGNRALTNGANLLESLDADYRYEEALKWLADAETAPSLNSAPQASPKGIKLLDQPSSNLAPIQTPRNVAASGKIPANADDEKQNKAILAKLNERIAMPFASDTPLDDIIKYIQQTTQDEAAGLPQGIPIYVDPLSLQDIDKTMSSATVTINLQGITLKTTLRLLLSQVQLVFKVEDGLLIIESQKAEPVKNGQFQ